MTVLAAWTYTLTVLLFSSAHPHPNDRPVGMWRFSATDGAYTARANVNDPAFGGHCSASTSGALTPQDTAVLAKRAAGLDGKTGGIYEDPHHATRDIVSESGGADEATKKAAGATSDRRDARAVVVHYLPCPQKTK